jgi:acyl dehydratase
MSDASGPPTASPAPAPGVSATSAAPAAIPASGVGTTAGPLVHAVDARWLMAYAAGLGEEDARYFDTSAAGRPEAHPLFAVCYEWPGALAIRPLVVPEAAARFGVHAAHHLVIHRPPRAGDVLSTMVSVEGIESHRAGALVRLRFETRDAAGDPVTTTRHESLYRGVGVDAGSRAGDAPSPRAATERAPADVRWQDDVAIPAQAAHVYTECARIWNPIHTDVAVARAAGLPGIILHGTATLALAVSRVVAREAGGAPGRVREVAVRFSGMVPVPSTIAVRGFARRADRIPFDALDARGRAVLSEGTLCLSPP